VADEVGSPVTARKENSSAAPLRQFGSLPFSAIAAFLAYLALSILLFGRGLQGHLTTACIGRQADPPAFLWYIGWWRYVFENRINPFLTGLLWAPRGINLAWSTFIPLPAWIAVVLGHAFGENAAYDFLCILALPLAALSAFLLCKRVSGSFWPSMLGGYLFGFSPYMLGHLLGGHLHLMLAFPIPLAALAGLRRLADEISARRFTVEIAALLVIQFLCGIELFATMTLFGGFAILVAMFVFDRDTRGKLLALIGLLAAAYAIAMIVVSPYLYYLFALGFPRAPIWGPGLFTGDVLNFFIPTETNLLGNFGFARAIVGNFGGDIYENTAYIGIPLLILVEAYRRTWWHTSAGKYLIAMLAIAVVASFGPARHVAGRPLFPMPWAVFAILPVLSNALPVRFTMYASLLISLIAAIWFSSASPRLSTKFLAAGLIVPCLAPNPSAFFWIRPLNLPAFFADGSFTRELQPREIVLPVPFGPFGDSMYWQESSDMYFRMASGWTGIIPFEFARMPLFNYFYGAIDLPEAGDQLKAYLARFGVQAVIADPAGENFPIWQQTLATLGVTPQNDEGVSIYQIPRDSLAAYAKLSGAQVEARANALRFDTILEAGGKFLADGNEPSKLSALELKRHDLLPHDWLVDSTPNAFVDWQIAGISGDRIAIIIAGSYEGVRALIERYRAIASEIDYPAPARWTPQSSPPEDQMGKLMMIFDRAQFETAARQLKSSPPPEMTTPFLGADSH
jgi:hypothetical protein